ncbi:uncharacterized protein LOC116174399 [Photinus pyralis]|uniref:Uncharacterized protein n=1 Tax=Photinus pyralis TaxID=7054 RepID=A0A1Y1N8E7_PHOPY|nr:uncharacterized protein LOC116174399 [Photinus pyralis]
MKAFQCILLTLGLVSSGSGLLCYVCVGTEASDCAEADTFAMSITNCIVPFDNFNFIRSDVEQLKAVCITVTATDFNPKLVDRGCGIFPNQTSPCEFLENTKHFENCTSCNTDKCNNKKHKKWI